MDAAAKKRTSEEIRYLFKIISHDIDNVLSLISGATQSALKKNPQDFLLNKAVKGTKMLERIVASVKQYEKSIAEEEDIALEEVSSASGRRN